MLKRINSAITAYDKIRREILDVIGYKSKDDSILIREVKYGWRIENGTLYLWPDPEDDPDDYFSMEVSSYGAMGQKEFYGVKDELMFVMCYNEERHPEETEIYILDFNMKQDIEL